DQQTVPSEGGQALIRRVVVPRRAERQSLPPGLAGLTEAVDPGKRPRPQVADTIGRWQRSGVEEQAGGAISWREREGAGRLVGKFHGVLSGGERAIHHLPGFRDGGVQVCGAPETL